MRDTREAAEDGAVIALRGVGVRKQGRWLLQDITWNARPGEQWAVLGANGSGKTTLLKVITGYEWPTAGTVSVLGRPFGRSNIPRLRRRIGWVGAALEQRIPSRDSALTVALSGIDATFGVYRTFAPSEEDQAWRILTVLGMDGLAHQPFGLLSQGERQRALIARALTAEPALLVLDDPCAGLDPAARETFLADLARLRGAGPGLLLVTHHVEEIGPSVDQVLMLKSGQVLAQGPPALVLRDDVLTEAFGRPCAIERRNGRYTLHVDPPSPDEGS